MSGHKPTMAQALSPAEGSAVEFWCHRMGTPGLCGTGIRGWFEEGLFWSHDRADHYAAGEVVSWARLSPADVPSAPVWHALATFAHTPAGRTPVAWADEAAAQGRVGNCASAAAKAHWMSSHAVDRSSAERLKHPLFSQAQLDAELQEARELIEQLVACHEEPTCPAVALATQWLNDHQRAATGGNHAPKEPA